VRALSASAVPSMSSALDYRRFPVLFVDDEAEIVETLRFSYEREFAVHGATSGEEALAIVAREPVAVLVSDQRMPGMSGLEVVAHARAIRPTLVPMILTGYTDLEALTAAVSRGDVERYILKPWNTQELRLAVRQAIDKWHGASERTCGAAPEEPLCEPPSTRGREPE
jgi:DNA-binding NtrC family response regulator